MRDDQTIADRLNFVIGVLARFFSLDFLHFYELLFFSMSAQLTCMYSSSNKTFGVVKSGNFAVVSLFYWLLIIPPSLCNVVCRKDIFCPYLNGAHRKFSPVERENRGSLLYARACDGSFHNNRSIHRTQLIERHRN